MFSCFGQKSTIFCYQFKQSILFSSQLVDSVEGMDQDKVLRFLRCLFSLSIFLTTKMTLNKSMKMICRCYGVITVTKDWLLESLYDREVKAITGKLEITFPINNHQQATSITFPTDRYFFQTSPWRQCRKRLLAWGIGGASLPHLSPGLRSLLCNWYLYLCNIFTVHKFAFMFAESRFRF